MIVYLKENTDLSFKDWQCVTALILPNSNNSHALDKHLCLNHHNLIPDTKAILAKLKIDSKSKFEINEEYECLAALAMASIHSAVIANTNGILELCQIPSEGQRTHAELAGAAARPDGPGWNVDKLADDVRNLATGPLPTYGHLKADKKSGKEKEPGNSYISWIFWNPSQYAAISKKANAPAKTRLIIHGGWGTGKTQVLMARALNDKQKEKRVCFLSFAGSNSVCGPEENTAFNDATKKFCERENIDFFGREESWMKNFHAFNPINKEDGHELRQGILKLVEKKYDCLYIDEFPQVIILIYSSTYRGRCRIVPGGGRHSRNPYARLLESVQK